MQYNGIVLSSTFMKLGVLIPTIMAVICFGEKTSVVQVIGIAIAVVFLFHEKLSGQKAKALVLVLVAVCLLNM